jgi:hypothetical protein
MNDTPAPAANTRQIAFTAPLSIDSCIKRLKMLETTTRQNKVEGGVRRFEQLSLMDLTAQDYDHAAFRVKRVVRGTKSVKEVRLSGTLTRTGPQTTAVTARIALPIQQLLFLPGLMLVLLILPAIYQPEYILIGVAILIATIIGNTLVVLGGNRSEHQPFLNALASALNGPTS